MRSCFEPCRHKAHEEGHVFFAVLIALALFMLSLSVAIPEVKKEIQHNKELETVRRGRQYIRAIQLYYRRFHSYPPNVEALINTNEIRFLRKRYTDPITGKGDWQPILLGKNKAPTALGFFGEPLGAEGATISKNVSGGGSGHAKSSPSGSARSNGDANPDVERGAAGQTFGGAGIIGFSPASPKQAILVYKTKSHYDEWEFVYDTLADWSIRGLLPTLPRSGPPTNTGSPGFNLGPALSNRP